MDICEDLIVEHEGEALLDSGLVGQPVIQQAYLNDCFLLYNNHKIDYSKDWAAPNDLKRVPVCSKLLQNHLKVDICKDLIVEHEGEALLDGGLGGQPVIQQAYLNDCLLLYNNLKMDYSEGRRLSGSQWWKIAEASPCCSKLLQNHLEVDICEDLIVEHEGEALLDGGLGGQPVIQQAYLNDCLLLYNNLKMDYSKGWVVPNDGK